MAVAVAYCAPGRPVRLIAATILACVAAKLEPIKMLPSVLARPASAPGLALPSFGSSKWLSARTAKVDVVGMVLPAAPAVLAVSRRSLPAKVPAVTLGSAAVVTDVPA